jgi:hypothetical protein
MDQAMPEGVTLGLSGFFAAFESLEPIVKLTYVAGKLLM